MLLEEMGELIDSFDTVIRLKRCQQTLEKPEFYGTKTDVIAGSLTIAGALRDIPADSYWVFADSRHEGWEWQDKINAVPNMFRGKHVFIDSDLCTVWNNTYRNMRAAKPDPVWDEQMAASRYDHGEGENHLSAGLHALIYACAYLKPDEVHMIGFDNVMTGRFDWSVTRGEDWKKYPRHRWDLENEIAGLVSETYGVPIAFVMPDPPERAANE